MLRLYLKEFDGFTRNGFFFFQLFSPTHRLSFSMEFWMLPEKWTFESWQQNCKGKTFLQQTLKLKSNHSSLGIIWAPQKSGWNSKLNYGDRNYKSVLCIFASALASWPSFAFHEFSSFSFSSFSDVFWNCVYFAFAFEIFVLGLQYFTFDPQYQLLKYSTKLLSLSTNFWP